MGTDRFKEKRRRGFVGGRRPLFRAVARAEGFEREDAAVVCFVDHGFDARELGVGYFGAVTVLSFYEPDKTRVQFCCVIPDSISMREWALS